MTTADFLRRIFDDPRNDEPRLDFADWLEDRGQVDRANWIRVGCRIAVIDWGDEWDKLVDDSIELFKKCRPEYWESITGVSALERRGLFVMETYKSPTASGRLGEALWLDQAREDGWIEGLHIKNIGSDGELKTWKQPALNCRLFLKPVPQIDDSDMSGLLAMPNLTGISLSHRMYEECPSLRNLSAVPKLEKLVLEELRNDHVTGMVLDQLPALSELRQLELSGSDRPTDEDLRGILSLKHLKDLDINCDSITDSFVVELQTMSSLRNITLDCGHVTNEAIDELRNARLDLNLLSYD